MFEVEWVNLHQCNVSYWNFILYAVEEGFKKEIQKIKLGIALIL